MQIKGFNEFTKKLDRLAKNASKLDGTHNVPVTEMITNKFIRSHSSFQTAQEFFDAGGIQTQEDIETEAWDQFVRNNTNFDGWQPMIEQAGSEWAQTQLFKGVR